MYCYKARCFTFPTGFCFWVIVFHWFNYLIVFKQFGIEIPLLPYSASSGADSEGVRRAQSTPLGPHPLWLKMSFSWEILDKFDKFGKSYFPQILIPPLFLPYTSLRPFYYLRMCVKLLGEWKTVYILIRHRVSQISSICGQCVCIYQIYLGLFCTLQSCFTFLIEFLFWVIHSFHHENIPI